MSQPLAGVPQHVNNVLPKKKLISRLADICGYTSCPVLQEPKSSSSFCQDDHLHLHLHKNEKALINVSLDQHSTCFNLWLQLPLFKFRYNWLK